MYDQIAVLAKNTFPYKIPNYPVLDFMGYLERFEHDKGLFSAELLEQPQDLALNPSLETLVNYSKHSFEKAYPLWVRMFTHPFEKDDECPEIRSYRTSRRNHHYSKYYNDIYCTGQKYTWELSEFKRNRKYLHVNDLNDQMITAAITTLRYLMMQRMPHCTAKEILLLVTVLSNDIKMPHDKMTPLNMASIKSPQKNKSVLIY